MGLRDRCTHFAALPTNRLSGEVPEYYICRSDGDYAGHNEQYYCQSDEVTPS